MTRIRRLLLGAVTVAALLFAAHSGYSLFEKGLVKERADADLPGAIKIYEQVLRQHSRDRKLAAQALVRIGQCHERLGDAGARKAYEQVISKFGDQTEAVAQAKARLAALGRAAPAGGAVVRRVLKDDAYDLGGGLSPDGRFIAYEQGADLMLFETGTGQKRPITGHEKATEPGYNGQYAAFSRDSREIAYLWFTEAGGAELRVRNLDGSPFRTLKQDTSAIQPYD